MTKINGDNMGTTLAVGLGIVFPLVMGAIEWLGGPGALAIAFMLTVAATCIVGVVWLAALVRKEIHEN